MQKGTVLFVVQGDGVSQIGGPVQLVEDWDILEKSMYC